MCTITDKDQDRLSTVVFVEWAVTDLLSSYGSNVSCFYRTIILYYENNAIKILDAASMYIRFNSKTHQTMESTYLSPFLSCKDN